MDELVSYLKTSIMNKDTPVSLEIRMQSLLNEHNNNNFSEYKPRVISLKSKDILEYLNFPCNTITEKITRFKTYNDILLSVSKTCYNRFNPSMIYTFNNEIHMVFYNTSDYPDLYNGNMNKTLTTMSSYVSRLFTKEFIKNDIDFDFTIYAKYAEFDKEYETLNYLVWRQHDCKRNNIITLYKYLTKDVINTSLDDITQCLFHDLSDINITYKDLEFLIYGNILKKKLVYIKNKQETALSCRKELNVSHELLHMNFKENVIKYILNTYL
jgi:hypothetical protein